MVCIECCNSYIAVDACIDSQHTSVKKKTNEEWKNGQQFFPRRIEFRLADVNPIDIELPPMNFLRTLARGNARRVHVPGTSVLACDACALLHKLRQRSGFAPFDQVVQIGLAVFGVALSKTS